MMGRCEVTTTFIAIALFCCQKFDHSRSLFITLNQSTAVDFASSQEEELRKNLKKPTTSSPNGKGTLHC
jgi:hypothetical protein